jgi:SOS-response transcriptional repressor LexA
LGGQAEKLNYLPDRVFVNKPNLNPLQKEFVALMAASGWSASETARQIACTRQNVHYIVKGKSTPSSTMMELLRTKALASKYPQRAETVLVADAPSTPSVFGRLGKTMSDIRAAITEYVRFAPLISWASAGNARAFEDQEGAAEWLPTICKDANCYALEVEGDSMEPNYKKGDIIFVAPQGEPLQGHLVVAKTMSEEVFFKLYRWSGHKNEPVILTSINPGYEPIMKKRRDFRFIQPVHSILRIDRRDL